MLVSVLILSISVTGCQPASSVDAVESVSEQVAPGAPAVATPPASTPPPVMEPEPEEVSTFDKSTHSLDDASSLWVVVNKTRPFSPIDYAPDDLVVPHVASNYSPLVRQIAAEALEEMFAEATSSGLSPVLNSSYRSYSLQQRVKRESLERYGATVSDARSARPGHSEHQTGLVVDITTPGGACTLNECFAETPEGLWLAENSWKYGFVLRYLEDASDTTGYIYEPWHFRFVGTELATEIWNQGYPTLEEFFGLPSAPNYGD